MNTRTITISITAGAVVALGLATANHVHVALSTPYGAEVLSEVTYMTATGSLGVPAYVTGSDEHGFHIHDGSTFHVSDGATEETMTFLASDFVDVHHATPHEIVSAINADLTLVEAFVHNESVVLRGMSGGGDAMLALTDDVGIPLTKMQLVDDEAGAGTAFGSDDVALVLSLSEEDSSGGGHPHDDHLAFHPYVIVASATEGVTPVAGFELPFALDETTDALVRAMQLGLVEGFAGELDADQDASAVFDAALIETLYGDDTPDALHFAFVVFDTSLTGIEFVSNRFTVDIQ